MEALISATPVQQAAQCLADDPSFRFLESLEEQRAEARLLLQGIPGGNIADADEAIMLALDMQAADAGVEEIAVSKANYGEGVWKERKISVRRPALTPVAYKPTDLDLTGPQPMVISDKRKRQLGIPVRKPPRPERKRPRGLSAADRRKQRQVSAGLLNGFRVATGMSIESISRLLDKSRPTVQFYLTGELQWAPQKKDLVKLQTALLGHQKLLEGTLAELRDVIAAAPADEEPSYD